MSTATFRVRARAVRRTACDLEILTLPAIEASAMACTRSFALDVLAQATPSGSPLDRALAAAPRGALSSAEWHREHVGQFIAATALGPRRRHQVDLADRWARIERLPRGDQLAAAWRLAHVYRLRVEVTLPAWLEGLEAGRELEVVAEDWWLDDPRSAVPPPPPEPAVAPPAEARARASASPATFREADHARLLAGLTSEPGATLAFEGPAETTSLLERALREPDGPLDPRVELARLCLVNADSSRAHTDAHEPLARLWLSRGGPTFVLDVLAAKIGAHVRRERRVGGGASELRAKASTGLAELTRATRLCELLAGLLRRLPPGDREGLEGACAKVGAKRPPTRPVIARLLGQP